MENMFIVRQVEGAVRDALGDTGVRVFERIRKMAAKQGGENALENYQLLGKRALVVLGVAIVVVQVAGSVVGFIVSRKSEEQRVERVVRRVLEEERQKEAGEGDPA